MGRVRMSAGDKGVKPLDTMNKTLIHQKRQRAIGNRGLCPEPICIKPRKNIIGPKSGMCFQQNLKRAPPHRRELHLSRGTSALGGCKAGRNASAMVVRGKAFWG